MNNKNKNNDWSIVATFAVISILILTIITTFSSILTLSLKQAQAQSLNIIEQKADATDINMHFKTACISIIVFTYCW